MATLFSHKIYGGVVDMGNRIEGSASVFTWAHSVWKDSSFHFFKHKSNSLFMKKQFAPHERAIRSF